jgi:hypothetical protein
VSSSNRPSKRPSSFKAPSALASPRRREVAAPARGDRAPASGDQRFPPAAARLTIKPGPPPAPRTQLQLSSQPRPPGPRLLSQVELDEDEVLIDAFAATLDGVRVRITAVLERTGVYVDRDGDRRLARKNDLWVEADKLPISRRSAV